MTPTTPAEKPVLSGGLAKIIIIALGFISPLIERIKNEYARDQLLRFVTPLQETLRALSDADPSDGKQIQAILFEFFTTTGFSADTKVQLLTLVNTSAEIKDQRVKEILSFFITWTFDMLPLILDEDKDTDKQILAFLEAKLRSEDGVRFLEVVLSFMLKDPEMSKLIAAIIAEVLKGVIDNPGLATLVTELLNKKV